MTAWEDLRGAAPPALLRGRPVADAEEVLVLTYTCDLSFFEDVCLREAQAVRARTTILYDADRLTQKPRGNDYLALPVVCRAGGAFHPKLVVIASEADTVVAIGSGNATPSGWHHNAEVWTMLRSADPTVPQVFHDLAAWLRRLPDAVWMEDLGRERLGRVADILSCRPAEGGPGQPVLVTTATRPVIEQLPVPNTLVTSLAVAAPFFDPRAEALRRLVDRFGPTALNLMLTRDVQCDPDALAKVVKQATTGVVTTPDSSRYHHAKIVEWETADRSWALTGSANCSMAALVKTMAMGGNCELGLLTETQNPLITAVPVQEIDLARPEDLHAREPGERVRSGIALRILGVRVSTERVEATALIEGSQAPAWLMVDGLQLDHERSDGRLHLYAGVPAPDWSFTIGETATVRVVTDTGAEIRDVVVTDVTAALSRIDRPSPLEHASLHVVIADQAHLAALFDALAHLSTVRPDRIATPQGTSRRRRVEGRITTAVGPALLRFALGMDRILPTPADDDIFDGLDNEDDGPQPARQMEPRKTGNPPLRPETVATVLDALTTGQRTRLRREIERLVDTSQGWPLPAKLAVSRLVLTLVAGGLWADPADWSDLLYWLMMQLWTTDQEESLEDEHAALATIGLVALHTGLNREAEPDSAIAEKFEELRQAYAEWTDWLGAVPEETVRRYAAGLSGHTLGALFGQTDFVAELSWILSRSALQDAVDRLTDARLDSGGVVRVAAGRTTRLAVLAALDVLRDFPDTQVASEAEPAVHGWWNRRRLLLVTRTGANWRAEVWSHLMTGIAAYSRGTPLPPPNRRWTASEPDDAATSTRL
ncbi:hypothetical protein O7606_07865 [Micromonospora sp. WMMD882]|uniref:hypothetical protein n=1 Tax=Micromonospora sp. WMMD882 TaxID=3015151 RepID=UPI00248B2BAF|nr:hypothetical protein [Micromonospora sp. WMMD882]WBB81279.1 hypothetical protein O7606_07865 [Micromonospora sp. WMMD882]